MTLQPPKWAAGSVMSPQGWRHPRTGELLVCRKFTAEQVAAHESEDELLPETKKAIAAVEAKQTELVTEPEVIAEPVSDTPEIAGDESDN